jgi:hypothetical protein
MATAKVQATLDDRNYGTSREDFVAYGEVGGTEAAQAGCAGLGIPPPVCAKIGGEVGGYIGGKVYDLWSKTFGNADEWEAYYKQKRETAEFFANKAASEAVQNELWNSIYNPAIESVWDLHNELFDEQWDLDDATVFMISNGLLPPSNFADFGYANPSNPLFLCEGEQLLEGVNKGKWFPNCSLGLRKDWEKRFSLVIDNVERSKVESVAALTAQKAKEEVISQANDALAEQKPKPKTRRKVSSQAAAAGLGIALLLALI